MGARFHIPHGRSNSLLLTHVVEYNAGNEMTAKRYQSLAAALHLPSANAKIAVSSLLRQIKKLQKEIGLGRGILEYGIDRQKFLDAAESMADAAIRDHCYATNPVKASREEIIWLYQKLA